MTDANRESENDDLNDSIDIDAIQLKSLDASQHEAKIANDQKNAREEKKQMKKKKRKDREYMFDWFFFRLPFLDKYTNWKLSFAFLCLSCFVENFVISGSASVVLSSLEKEFFLTSTKSGLFLGIYEVAGFFAAPIFGYIATSYHINKMRLISLSLLLVFIGSYIIGLTVFMKSPDLDFIADPNDTLSNNLNLCIPKLNSSGMDFDEECGAMRSMMAARNNEPTVQSFQVFLYIGHLIIGFGGVVIYSIGIAYVEELCLPVYSPYCQAIFYGTGSIGGAIGILITGRFLDVNARFYMKSYAPNDWITPSNPYWIGAWWLPYIIYGGICGILSLIVFGFPHKTHNPKLDEYNKEMAKQQRERKQTENDSDTDHHVSSEQFRRRRRQDTSRVKHAYDLIIHFFGHFKEVILNFKLFFIILSTATEGIILKGFLGFMVKYVEYQFDLSATTSTMIMGAIALSSVIFGSLFSAYLINRYKWETKENAIFCCIVFFVTSFLFLVLFVYCPEKQFVPISNACLDERNCSCTNRYNPVCMSPSDHRFDLIHLFSSDDLKHDNRTISMFQSPCHIGCSTQLNESDFTDCKCLASSKEHGNTPIVLSTSKCDKNVKCMRNLVINGIGAFFIVFLTAISLIPHIKAAIGCVDRVGLTSFSLGVRAALTAVIGNFAGSVLVGQTVDLTCKYWLNNCFGQQVCKLYNNRSMAISLALIGFVCRFLSSIFMVISCIFIIRDAKRKQHASKEAKNVEVDEDAE